MVEADVGAAALRPTRNMGPGPLAPKGGGNVGCPQAGSASRGRSGGPAEEAVVQPRSHARPAMARPAAGAKKETHREASSDEKGGGQHPHKEGTTSSLVRVPACPSRRSRAWAARTWCSYDNESSGMKAVQPHKDRPIRPGSRRSRRVAQVLLGFGQIRPNLDWGSSNTGRNSAPIQPGSANIGSDLAEMGRRVKVTPTWSCARYDLRAHRPVRHALADQVPGAHDLDEVCFSNSVPALSNGIMFEVPVATDAPWDPSSLCNVCFGFVPGRSLRASL